MSVAPLSDILTEISKTAESPSSADALFTAIAGERANGKSAEYIAEKYGVSENFVTSLERKASFREQVSRMQCALDLTLPERIEKAASVALDKQIRLLFSADEKVVAAVSQNILDRHLGKATQRIESKSLVFNVSQRAEQLDSDIESIESQIRLMEVQKQKLRETQLV
jgi:transcriptional regulator with XRE-family HTH domain